MRFMFAFEKFYISFRLTGFCFDIIDRTGPRVVRDSSERFKAISAAILALFSIRAMSVKIR